MSTHTATAQAHPNIAFIKYWGNRDNALRIPSNGSISMNLEELFTRTTVSFQPSLALDELVLNGREVTGPGLQRVSAMLDLVRQKAHIDVRAEVVSEVHPATVPSPSCASSCAVFAIVSAVRAEGRRRAASRRCRAEACGTRRRSCAP